MGIWKSPLKSAKLDHTLMSALDPMHDGTTANAGVRIVGKVMGRGGLEPPTSVVTGAER